MKMIDCDNMVSTILHPDHAQQAIELIKSGKITDMCGDVVDINDCLDRDGELCVDEDMYGEIKQRLQI